MSDKFKYNHQGYNQAKRFLLMIPEIFEEFKKNKLMFRSANLTITKANKFYRQIKNGEINTISTQGS